MRDVLEQIVGSPLVIEQLKHKPGRRRTMRARGPGGSVIMKVYVSSRAPMVAQRVASLAAEPTEPVVPSVIRLDTDRHLLVLSEIAGRPLREALLDGDLASCARAGGALGAWHAAWRERVPDALQPHTSEKEIAILRERAGKASPPVAAAVEDALTHLALPWTCSTVVHRDLYEEQVLVGDRIGLIDLDDAAAGPPELDIGNLIAHIELLESRQRHDARAAKRALLDAYADACQFDDALFERCRSLALLRLACLNDEIGLVRPALAGVSA